MKRGFVLSAVLISVVALTATLAFAADMFSGTWKLNVAGSGTATVAAGTQSSQTITAIDNGLKIVNDIVGESGQKGRQEFTVLFDGKDYPYKTALDGTSNPNAVNATVSAKKIDDYTLELTFKVKGNVFLVSNNVVSNDGKTMTATVSGKGPQGQAVTNTAVWKKE